MHIILRILFFFHIIRNIIFINQKLIYIFYTIAKALLITKYIKVTNKKKFVRVNLNKNIKLFIIYIVFLNLEFKIMIYLIQNDSIIFLNIEKILKSILTKNLNFINIFFKKLTIELFERLNINKYTINLVIDK